MDVYAKVLPQKRTALDELIECPRKSRRNLYVLKARANHVPKDKWM